MSNLGGTMNNNLTADMADRVINHMQKLTLDKPGDALEARALAEESMRLAGFENFYEPDVSKLIWALSDMKADRMACMTAACLLLDYRTLNAQRQEQDRQDLLLSKVA